MSDLVLDLDHPDASDPSRCGHKAGVLATLKREGFDVPDGFVVTASAASGQLPVAAIGSALTSLGDGPVVVRSSGLAEDLADASFAGQYESYLGVTGLTAVLDAVRRCIASARSARVVSYRGEDAAAPMAVLVQRMVPADAAGVAFSIDPVTGDRDVTLVSAVPGLADKLVAGEVSGDEWVVRQGTAEPVSTPHGALAPTTVARIAQLAERLERTRGAPQDIEWALVGDRIRLLQSRPVTALPTPPSIKVPDGLWMKDVAHFDGPVTPLAASAYLPTFEAGTVEMCSTWGLMVERVQCRAIGGEVYTRAVPVGGGSETASPPPWWVLAVVARLHPAIRERLRLSRQAIDGGLLDSIPRQWEQWRAELVADLAQLQAVDLVALPDDELVAHIDRLLALFDHTMRLHFRLFVPYLVGVHGLVSATNELLGWDTGQAMALLQGTSAASSAPSRALAELAGTLRDRADVVAVLDDGGPDLFERLRAADAEAAARVEAYRDTWAIRTLGYDPGTPTLAEQPALLAALIRDAIADTAARTDLEAGRQARIADARRKLAGPALERFDAALAYAELVYPQREDNVILTDNVPCGLLRLTSLEVGRRLVARGRLARATDVAYLLVDELRGLDSTEDLGDRVTRRKNELLWVQAHPGPTTYGGEPPAAPDVRGLPAASRRVNGAILWAMQEELVPPRPSSGDGLAGLPASPGRYTGHVRVVRSYRDLDRLRPGEVLVCPITTPAWSVMFSLAGALVTDGGSALSHSAIIAREHGIPAVVATIDGTTRLRDGQRVVVDGMRGTVEVLS